MPKPKKVKCAYCGKKFEPNSHQVGNMTRGQDVYCPGGECYYKASLKKSNQYWKKRKRVPQEITCGYRECNNVFMSTTHRYCPGTNHAYLETLARQKARGKKKKPRVVAARSGRKCRLCGCDPYPNYYFCKMCHSRVGDNDLQDEHSISVWA